MKRVLLALSGGVDSSVSAELLKRMGYDVGAAVMIMSELHGDTVTAAEDASKRLGIPLYTLDLRSEFKYEIIDYFAKEYLRGRTPNPCVRCNPRVKFKYLLKTALEGGYDFISTGHYANIEEKNGVHLVTRAASSQRDQSYMLAGLRQDVLSRLICPLGSMEKSEVRNIASSLGLKCHDAPDSVENCFIPGNNYASYIEEYYGISEPGNFVIDETVCGRHRGILHYTIGQRKGLGIALGRPAYVSRIDPIKNEVRLSYEKAMTDRIYIDGISQAFDGSLGDGMECFCKLRSTGRLLKCRLAEFKEGKAEIMLDETTPAVSAGQAAVIYDGSGNAVLGMGVINSYNIV